MLSLDPQPKHDAPRQANLPMWPPHQVESAPAGPTTQRQRGYRHHRVSCGFLDWGSVRAPGPVRHAREKRRRAWHRRRSRVLSCPQAGATDEVVVLQWSCGTDARQRSPRGAHPECPAILVDAPFGAALGPVAHSVTMDERQPCRLKTNLGDGDVNRMTWSRHREFSPKA